MMSIVRLLVALTFVSASGVLPSVTVLAQAPQQQEEFIPIDQLPPQEQLPAAPLLIGAYAFVLAMLFLYFVSVSRRLGAIERDVDRLDAELGRHDKA